MNGRLVFLGFVWTIIALPWLGIAVAIGGK